MVSIKLPLKKNPSTLGRFRKETVIKTQITKNEIELLSSLNR